MLTLVGEQNRLCDRIPRRAFLTIGALGGLTLADVRSTPEWCALL
jgi:hypothetical protein